MHRSHFAPPFVPGCSLVVPAAVLRAEPGSGGEPLVPHPGDPLTKDNSGVRACPMTTPQSQFTRRQSSRLAWRAAWGAGPVRWRAAAAEASPGDAPARRVSDSADAIIMPGSTTPETARPDVTALSTDSQAIFKPKRRDSRAIVPPDFETKPPLAMSGHLAAPAGASLRRTWPAFLGLVGALCAAADADPRSADWFYNPFAADSAHHRPIGTGAVYAGPDHLAVIDFQQMGAFNINVGSRPWGCGIWEAKSTDPLMEVAYESPDRNGDSAEFPAKCRLPLPMVMKPRRDGVKKFDGVLVVYDRATETIHHFRQFNWHTDQPTPAAKPTASSHKTWSIRGPAHNDRLGERVGTSASGVAAMFGILRGWEVKAAGHPIGHALQMVLPCRPRDQHGIITLSREVWWPAVSMDGFAYSHPENATGHVPYGSLWAIPPVAQDGPDLTKLGLSEQGLRLAECIRDYGLYAVDTGGTTAIRADQEFTDEEAAALRGETAKFFKYIRLVTNSVPEEGKVKFNVGDTPTRPTGGGGRQLVAGAFPAGGGEPLAPNTAIGAR